MADTPFGRITTLDDIKEDLSRDYTPRLQNAIFSLNNEFKAGYGRLRDLKGKAASYIRDIFTDKISSRYDNAAKNSDYRMITNNPIYSAANNKEYTLNEKLDDVIGLYK